MLELATAISPEFAKLRRIILSWDSDHHIAPDHVEEIHDDAHNRFHELGRLSARREGEADSFQAASAFAKKDFAKEGA